ncbi:hypothetical protein UFOVP1290_628 [uncultured Caudovirales phage]|uniref:Uncharacterized protein n=1 Tax=uncultured Caudovirales phage TaxID=2100421 RepID=A0A6J5RU48_9CAUD|nr:hypothetical protein UFOVP1290_628 [uncultured Caudovirales phage]
MTFKHANFEDSPTMRSLIRLATDKGWVKDDPIEKVASNKIDLSVTDSLTENILKLCSGLRQSGMDKQAEELEVKFMQYKRACGLYDISKESGEDLVNAAHPDGSHKMEGLNHEVKTIIDKHLAMLGIVNKNSTGKLTNANQILNSVKMALGQQLPIIPALDVPAKQIAKQVVTKAPAYSRLMAALPGGTTSVSGAAAGGAAGIAGIATAVTIGAIIGITASVYAWNKFDENFNPTEIKDAGHKLIEAFNSISVPDQNPTDEEGGKDRDRYNGARKKADELSSVINNINKPGEQNTVASLKTLMSNLSVAGQSAQDLYSYAKHYGGMFGGSTGFGGTGILSGGAGKSTMFLASTFLSLLERQSKLVEQAWNEISPAAQQVWNEAQAQAQAQAQKTKVNVKSEFKSVGVEKQFTTLLDRVNKLSATVNGLSRLTPEQKSKWVTFLSGLPAKINANIVKLQKLSDVEKNDDATLSPYQEKINKVSGYLDLCKSELKIQ